MKILAGPKTASPRDAYAFLEKARLDLLAYILAESSNSKVLGKIRNYLHKWKPLRQALPNVAGELEALGLEHGPKFDKVLEDFFQAQLQGKARKPDAHAKVLRKLAGIKELPKKVEEKKKPEKPKKKGEVASVRGTQSTREAARPKGAAPAPRAASRKEPSRKSVAGHSPVKASPKRSHKKKARSSKK